MADSYFNAIPPESRPQDPYYPQLPIEGASFLDTAACLCAYQEAPGTSSNTGAWQCIGNQTQGVYTVRTGKWFHANNAGGTFSNGSIDDASHPPDTANPQTWNSQTKSFNAITDINATSLSVYDKACTGTNQTTFSTAFYRAAIEKEEGQTIVDAAPCFQEGGVPVQIQDVDSWQSIGCLPGFLCANNTVNSLPQYCPPLAYCQEARVAGNICTFQGQYIGMGPFEPVVCQQGYYCPPGGTQKLRCPAGSYCQPGAATPTPCSWGSTCPEGAQYQIFYIPLVVLILIDLLLLIGIIWHSIVKRVKRRGVKRAPTFTNLGVKSFQAGMTGYNQIQDDNEPQEQHEMLPMNATYMPQRDIYDGFQAALDMGRLHDMTNMDAELSPQLRVFIESMRKATEATHMGLSFGYDNLSLQPRGSPKPILQNVTGSIERGSLVAVMGGSGAGKSTFVNVLMGKAMNTSGTVTINGVKGRIKRYKKLIGYVPQDDVVLPEMTVYENILHSARIRLPFNWRKEDIEAHVNSVIDCLELSHVRDSLVGSVGKPVISGGQRKRVSIGMELAAAPMAIFLDEPTSGLDATSASSIMRTLKALAHLGMTIIVIIHQPRMEIFEILDDLILLANGQIIYEGPENRVREYFERNGYHFPDHSNYGDVVSDIMTGNGRDYKRVGDISKESLIAYWRESRESELKKERHASTISIANTSDSKHQFNQQMHRALKTRGAPRFNQIGLCFSRAMVQQYRTKSTFWFEMGLAALAGFLIGLAQNSKQGVLFIGLYKEPFGILSVAVDMISAPQFALLVAIAIGLVAAAPGVRVFSEELLLQRRESEAGHSRLSYFIAKILSTLPRIVLGTLHFTTPVFILAAPVMQWGLAFVANLIYYYSIYGLSSIISMIMRREDAPLVATMISLIVGILSGAAPPLRKAAEWHVEWLWRASPGTWLVELYFGQLVSPFEYLYQTDLASQATGFKLDWLWRNILILFGIGTAYRVIAYVGLLAGKRLRV